MNRQSMACSAYNLQINCEVAAAIDRYSGDPMKSDLDERVREGEAKGLFVGYIAGMLHSSGTCEDGYSWY